MRILVLGTGGVGSAFAAIARRRDVLRRTARSRTTTSLAPRPWSTATDDGRFSRARGRRLEPRRRRSSSSAATRADAVLNAVDPRFNEPIFDACLAVGVTYLDMAMTLSEPHPERPYELTGVKLGDYQFERAAQWEERGALALVGMGVEPGLSDVFARHAADELFSAIDEVGVRDGANLVVEGYDFAPTFSIWTTIEECLNPPVVWERDRGWFTTAPFSEPEVFDFPEGIGPIECVNVEHEEVLLVPRYVDCRRVTFKYGLGDEFIEVLKTLHRLGLDRKEPIRVGGVEVAPRDVVAASLPDPATLGERMTGKTCAGTLVTGHRQRRTAATDIPLPRRRQRMVDARVRLAGGRLADRAQPRRRAGAAAGGDVVGDRRPGARGVPGRGRSSTSSREYGAPHGVLELEPS